MIDDQKLYELLKDFDPAVGERMEKHFKDGAFYFDLGGSSYGTLPKWNRMFFLCEKACRWQSIQLFWKSTVALPSAS